MIATAVVTEGAHHAPMLMAMSFDSVVAVGAPLLLVVAFIVAALALRP